MLRAAVRAEASGTSGELPEAVAAELLAARHASTDQLRSEVLDRLEVPVTLHAHPDPWATGASPGLTAAAPTQVDALLVPAWPTTPATADLVAATTSTCVPVGAYVTVLPPADPADLDAHIRRLRAAGASDFSLYHLGLAPGSRQPLLAQIVNGLNQ
jgi:hypothetical protein